MNHPYWILDDQGEPRAVGLLDWGVWMQGNMEKRHLAIDAVGDYHVSTVFLGLDHSFGRGPPLLWETMIFGPGEPDGDCWRYSTRLDAELGHVAAVTALKVQLGLPVEP